MSDPTKDAPKPPLAGAAGSERPAVVSLCDFTGIMVEPWADAGCECFCVDTQHSIRSERVNGRINYVWGDVRSWCPPRRPMILFGFPPCTHLCTSGARDWARKSWPMMRDGLDLFWSVLQAAQWAGCPYMIENPVGRISGIMGKSEHTFHPWQYGDPYQKLTCLWTGNGFTMPKASVTSRPGNCDQRIHTAPPSEDRANMRSATPRGFASAVFHANRHLIAQCEALNAQRERPAEDVR